MDFVIFGAGGFGREVMNFVTTEEYKRSGNRFIGFIDESEDIIGSKVNGHMVYHPSEFSNIGMICAIGNPRIRSLIVDKYSKSYELINVIHPNVNIPENVRVGKGNIICDGCKFTIDINIGDNNIFNLDVRVGHDVIVGNNNVFLPNVSISGNVTVGDGNLFGSTATIIQGKDVASNSVIGIGSTVLMDVPDNVTVLGCPAKIVKRR